jgi:hypothetical protein
MLWQSASPLVQVMQTPSLVVSHLHLPQHRLHWQTVMPFQVQQQLHAPPASILHRLCSAPHATSSSQTHLIFIPPVHFSILISQRGTISQLPAGAPGEGMVLIEGIPLPVAVDRSIIIIALDIAKTPFLARPVSWI